MALETEAMAVFQTLMKMDDKELEQNYNDLIKLFESGSSFEQTLIEKKAYCRANYLTEDDLIEENGKLIELADELELSPIKRKFINYLSETAKKVNDEIVKEGLFPKVKVRVERLRHNQKLPEYAHENGDSGLDVYLTDDIVIAPRSTVVAPIGIKVAIPLGYELQVRPRSGMSLKKEYVNLFVANSPGTIDANYRQEVGIILKNIGDEEITLVEETRIAQIVLVPVIKLEWVEVDNIDVFPTERLGGYGSTGDR